MSLKIISLLMFTSLVFAASVKVQAYTLDKDGLVRDEQNKILIVNQWDARSVCPNGTHLPTAREFAQYATTRGAKGQRYHPRSGFWTTPDGFYEIWSANYGPEDKYAIADTFFFSPLGYRHPHGNRGRECFWSSSFAEFQGFDAFCFSGQTGDLIKQHRGVTFHPVWCFPN